MTTPAPPNEALEALTLNNSGEDSNPWASKPDSEAKSEPPVAPLSTANEPPPEQPPVFTPEPVPAKVDSSVLAAFDPLVDKQQQEAADAWAAAEAHPPKPQPEPTEEKPLPPKEKSPPRTPDEVAQKPLPPDPEKPATSPTTPIPSSASAFTTTFASIARTFSRPRSAAGQHVDTAGGPGPSRLSGEVMRPVTPVSANARQDSRVKPAEPVFDFQRFLDQLKSRSAEPVAQYFRSFLNHFARRTFTVQDQVKLVQQFLAFIEPKMRECTVWRRESPEEFENTMEAMEKLVMNRIFEYTFTPQIMVSGRPVTTDDLERDHILTQRIRLFGWVSETHLDIPLGENNEGFLNFAQQELLKINHYKAPRDKTICILNCCKVIFGLLRQITKDQGADSFMPILILVVLKANPDNLISNIEYIQRFRSPDKLQSEAGYYLSSLSGAVSFIETMDHTSLSNITQEEFEGNVEEAIQNLPPSPSIVPPTPIVPGPDFIPEPPKTPSAAPAPGEESASALQLPTPASVAEDTRKFLQKTGTFAQQTISKPLNAIGKLLSDALDGIDDEPGKRRMEAGQWNHPDQYAQYAQYAQAPQTPQGGTRPQPIQAPYKARVRHGSGTPSPSHTPINPPPLPPRNNDPFGPYIGAASGLNDRAMGSRSPSPNFPARDLQAEIGAIEDAHRQAARDTVAQIFPHVEGEVIDMVLDANGGDLGRTIDALLEIAGTS